MCVRGGVWREQVVCDGVWRERAGSVCSDVCRGRRVAAACGVNRRDVTGLYQRFCERKVVTQFDERSLHQALTGLRCFPMDIT